MGIFPGRGKSPW